MRLQSGSSSNPMHPVRFKVCIAVQCWKPSSPKGAPGTVGRSKSSGTPRSAQSMMESRLKCSLRWVMIRKWHLHQHHIVFSCVSPCIVSQGFKPYNVLYDQRIPSNSEVLVHQLRHAVSHRRYVRQGVPDELQISDFGEIDLHLEPSAPVLDIQKSGLRLSLRNPSTCFQYLIHFLSSRDRRERLGGV